MAKRAEVNTRKLLAKYPNWFRAPKYRNHKSSGRAVIQYRPLWGPHPHYLPGLYGSPESLAGYVEACDAVYANKLATLKQKHEPDLSPPRRDRATVEEFLFAFLVWAKKHWAEDHRELVHYRLVAGAMRRLYGKEQVRSFGPVAAKEVRELLIQPAPPRNGQKPRTKPLARSNVNAQFNRLRNMFKWGIEHEFVTPDQHAILKAIAPLRPGKSAAIERDPVPPVPWPEVEKLLPFMPPILGIMVCVQRLTAMRSDELTKLRMCDVDQSSSVWIYRPKHKNTWRNKLKNIFIGPRAQELLRPLLDRSPDEYLFKPAELEACRNALRRSMGTTARSKVKPRTKKNRPRYLAGTYARAIGHARERARKFAELHGLPVAFEHWTPHQIRHLRATETREQYQLEGAQIVLGNSREATQIYAETSLPLAIRIATESG